MIRKIIGIVAASLVFASSSHAYTVEVNVRRVELDENFLSSLTDDQKNYLLDQLSVNSLPLETDDDHYQFIDMDAEERIADSGGTVWTHPERK